MREEKFYHAAVYLRLSREDEHIDGGKMESNSIGAQRDMICSYIRKQDNMEIYDTYVDDGYSGTDFNRPELKRMMKDIEVGNVNCVLVKDLSRLGRDYIEAGRLIQKIFPAFSVRFIALTDHFDSLKADDNETDLVVPIKNFINDSYARDISNKVRSHQQIRREKGDFIGAFAVFGYQKSRENRNQLVPDEYAAHVVKKIFAWKIEGYSNLAIAELLNDFGLLSPLEYKKMRGENFQTGFPAGIQAKWSAVAVKRILTNENYIGTLVQGKEEKINYKMKKSVRKPEAEWTKAEGAHKGIISKEDFALVQELLKTDTRAERGGKKAHMYAGLLFCGDCMAPMVRRINKYRGREKVSFVCSRKNKGEGCSRHKIAEEDLNRLVLAGLRQQIALSLDSDRALKKLEQIRIPFEEAAVFEEGREELSREQEKYQELQADLYEDLKRQLITEEDYKNFREVYEKRYRKLQQAVKNQKEIIENFLESEAAEKVSLEQMKQEMQIADLDRRTLVSFVKGIFVYEDKRVYLKFRYREPFSESLGTIEEPPSGERYFLAQKSSREEAV
ncbi:MAG: recombinase family protein [Lachnospiraceae bacterium]|nr:recombinase family protein [Lachnospiraceae bacterium]